MAVGPILTLGLGAFTGGGVQYIPTLGYGTSATPPSPPFGRSGLGGDDVPRRRSPHRGWDKEEWKRRVQDDREALERTLQAAYAEITGADAPLAVLAQVDAIVRPAAKKQASPDVPLRINWAAIANDYRRTVALIRLREEERALRDLIEEEDELLMMGAFT